MSSSTGMDLGLEALRALEEGFAHNSAGRPARASACFRQVLRRLGTPDDVGRDPTARPARGEAARDRGDGTDAAYLRARALLGMVMSDFELRADVAASLAVLDEAEAWARRAGAPAVEVAVHGQRGL
ncbi:hypothetical protein ICW40_08565, partial [Actinotalea ferrariae]|uniref:hypothetical protein n=1 Tax=Actinotalea ferrariae TaxID=1386098 RepID=UPI001C8C6C0B